MLAEFLIDRNFNGGVGDLPLAIYHTGRSFEITKLLEDPSIAPKRTDNFVCVVKYVEIEREI